MYRGNVDGGEEDRFNGSKMTVAMEHKRKSSWDSKVRHIGKHGKHEKIQPCRYTEFDPVVGQ